ncbi:hypothetical protein [Confluentibacter flavum]|uniref:Uncharacterized protein n=1 Tax=Confluentibacter flavum TaxID=1909700 RepID=A0A2N3HPB0_9FLAO|nr:hypothetical protein [Confluentibacter flavum]PKQ46694.1 hypothetical protein CSW08_01460 [Confluentibacter flavum]
MKGILIVLFFILVVGCETNESNKPDCSAVLCAALTISVNIIDEETNDNYIIENKITKNDIEVTNSKNESNYFELVSNPTSPYNGTILLYASHENTLVLNIKNLDEMTIPYEVSSPKTNECCDLGDIENLMVDNYPFEFDSELKKLTIYL